MAVDLGDRLISPAVCEAASNHLQAVGNRPETQEACRLRPPARLDARVLLDEVERRTGERVPGAIGSDGGGALPRCEVVGGRIASERELAAHLSRNRPC